MVNYERCPHCNKTLEIAVEVKHAGELGESIMRLTELNIKNAKEISK